MFKSIKLQKITTLFLFVILLITFSTIEGKTLEKYSKGENIANYFSGILLLNNSKYSRSYKYLKKLDGLEESHPFYASKYLYSLVNSGNFSQAYNFSKKLEKRKIDTIESNLVLGTHYLKNSQLDYAKKYFDKAKRLTDRSLLDNYITNSLYLLSSLKNIKLEKAESNLLSFDDRFENLNKIQDVFLYCYFNSEKTEAKFQSLLENQKIDFSRYSYFYAKYLHDAGKSSQAKKIIQKSLKNNPRNLLLNQYKFDLEKTKTGFYFDCNNESHIAAEILFISASALSSQSLYYSSNFYLNLAKYLNKEFQAYISLEAENFYNVEDFAKAKNSYKKLTNYGEAFKWYSYKQISKILIQEKKEELSIKLLSKAYNELHSKGLYEIFDYAEFLKNNEKFEESIKFYSEILDSINQSHPLFPEVTDSRGVAYERIGEWNKAEKDLLASLEASPDQAYVINYLAYSWIEQGVKINKSLEMLEKANKIKSNDPYIIDSLGWALFKLKRYEESKEYLRLAVRLLPADPIVNDHYGDVLWKNGNVIQARYYWNYVLNLEKAEKDLKDEVEKKLIEGL
tara:strand:- start:841 stop:2541 length:1701 start_codon:yes stop_codon:yes gene_type:complete